ncbi:MAG: UDP-N-acetylmuramate dehydrogenase [Planctomycetota bacterium]
MVLPSAFAEARGRAVALARRTAFHLGGRPEFLFEPEDAEEARQVLRQCRLRDVVVRVLGGGSNLLVGDRPLAGAVVATRQLRGIEVGPNDVVVGAGEPLPGLVRRAASLGIAGLAACAGIPGSVGGAVAMNAGGQDGTISRSLVWVEGVSAEGRLFHREVGDGDFGYRESVFDRTLLTRVAFRRDPGLDADAERRRLRRVLARKQATQPLGARCAGCIFRNPDRGPAAGRLIEDAGLKGRRIGDAVVSSRHANFIVNVGSATARDVRALIRLVREEVRRRSGIELELEVRVWV